LSERISAGFVPPRVRGTEILSEYPQIGTPPFGPYKMALIDGPVRNSW
jgi:hypothetical protein